MKAYLAELRKQAGRMDTRTEASGHLALAKIAAKLENRTQPDGILCTGQEDGIVSSKVVSVPGADAPRLARRPEGVPKGSVLGKGLDTQDRVNTSADVEVKMKTSALGHIGRRALMGAIPGAIGGAALGGMDVDSEENVRARLGKNQQKYDEAIGLLDQVQERYPGEKEDMAKEISFYMSPSIGADQRVGSKGLARAVGGLAGGAAGGLTGALGGAAGAHGLESTGVGGLMGSIAGEYAGRLVGKKTSPKQRQQMLKTSNAVLDLIRNNPRTSGAVIGAGLGAGTGALIDKENRGRGALIGGGLGGVAGVGVGHLAHRNAALDARNADLGAKVEEQFQNLNQRTQADDILGKVRSTDAPPVDLGKIKQKTQQQGATLSGWEQQAAELKKDADHYFSGSRMVGQDPKEQLRGTQEALKRVEELRARLDSLNASAPWNKKPN